MARYSNIYVQAADALDYAVELNGLRRVNSFRAELDRMAIRLGCEQKHADSLFATAVLHGFIAFDYRREWTWNRPLVLKGAS
jgi:predicted transcriptional regulator